MVVQELESGQVLQGVAAARRIAAEIPLYAPFRLLLLIPAIARAADREMSGCKDGSACELPPKRS